MLHLLNPMPMDQDNTQCDTGGTDPQCETQCDTQCYSQEHDSDSLKAFMNGMVGDAMDTPAWFPVPKAEDSVPEAPEASASASVSSSQQQASHVMPSAEARGSSSLVRL